MNRLDGRASRDITLAELLALHEEILALSRSGVPLSLGLQAAAHDLPTGMKQVVNQVAESLERGIPLDETLHRMPGIPAFYRAVVQSGLRSGRLPVALEGLTDHLRRVNDVRTTLAVSSIYPFLVLGLTGLLATWVLPPLYSHLVALQVSIHPGRPFDSVTQTLIRMSPWLAWGWLIPVLLIAIGIGLWLGSKRAFTRRAARTTTRQDWFPWLGRARHLGQWGLFCDLFALLLENRVAWNESLSLAADAVGPWRGGQELRKLAAQSNPNREAAMSVPLHSPGTPALLNLILSHGLSQEDTIRALRCTARDLQRRADLLSDQVRQWAPIMLTIVIACTAVTAYATLVMAPWSWQLFQIAREY